MRKGLVLLAPLLLTACVDGAAGYDVDGRGRALVMHVEQTRFWRDEVSLQLVASNLPGCQRRYVLGEVPAQGLDVELYADGNGVYTLRAGGHTWAVETNTCGQLAAPADDGRRLGAFRLIRNTLVFVEAGSTTLASREPGLR